MWVRQFTRQPIVNNYHGFDRARWKCSVQKMKRYLWSRSKFVSLYEWSLAVQKSHRHFQTRNCWGGTSMSNHTVMYAHSVRVRNSQLRSGIKVIWAREDAIGPKLELLLLFTTAGKEALNKIVIRLCWIKIYTKRHAA